MRFTIEHLAAHPDVLPLLAEWLQVEWGDHTSVDEMAHRLRKRLNTDRFPMALVALDDEHPLGTVSLKIQEMDIRPKYEHWLGTLYVHPDFRGVGIGSALVRAAEEQAQRLRTEHLYLYTRHAETETIYARLGWQTIEEPVYHGRPALIMRRTLHSADKQ